MADQPQTPKRLDTWNEIAWFLDVTVRTAMRWEQERGLPVHRAPGGDKQRVFAFPEELTEWRNGPPAKQEPQASASSSSSENAPPATPLPARPAGRMLLTALLGVVALNLCMVLAWFLWSAYASTTQPRLGTMSRLASNIILRGSGMYLGGNRIFLGALNLGNDRVASLSLDGGPLQLLDTPFINGEVAGSLPDGSTLLVMGYDGVERERQLWVMPTNGGRPERVGNMRCQGAAWSPDGRFILCATGNEILLTADRGKTSRRVALLDGTTTDLGYALFLRWSPDLKHLRFLVYSQKTDLRIPCELHFDAQLHPTAPRVIPFPEVVEVVDWSNSAADGRYFLEAKYANGHYKLLAAQEGNSRVAVVPRKLGVEFKDEMFHLMSLDASGMHLYAVLSAQDHVELMRVEANGGMTPFLAGISALDLDFSPDWKQVAYVKMDASEQLVVSNADGSNSRPLATGFNIFTLPRWSPDGTQIAFMGIRNNRPWRIYIVPAAGGEPREASMGEEPQGAPTWSPDGKFISYGGVECQELNLCAIHRLEVATGKVETIPGSEGLDTARWSPDGQYIAALRTDLHELHLYSLKSGKWKTLAGGLNGNDLNWSRDSRFLYANREYGNQPAILKVPVEGGTPQTVVSLAELTRLPGHIHTWFAVGPNASFLIARQVDSSELTPSN